MIREYCKISSKLTISDIEKIERVSETVSILSSILNMDVFLDCPTKDKDSAIVVYHARPEINSLYSKNIAGEIANSFKEPAVFRTFLTGLPSKNYKAITQEEQHVFQNIMPVFNEKKEVIGVIIVEYNQSQEKDFNSNLFNFTAAKLIRDVEISRSKIPEFVKDGIVVFNREGMVTYINNIAEKIYASLGFSKSMIGEQFENIALTKTTIQDISKQKMDETIEVTISNMTLSIAYFITHLDEDNYNIVMGMRDVTRERNNEQEILLKSVVIKEIHHRVKNNLQTIVSLLRIQKRRVDNEEIKAILEETMSRILSIATTHEVLSENGTDRINIKAILQLLYQSSFKNSIDKIKKIEFNVIGDDFIVSSDTATSVALVINELIQNALRYAFYNRTEGKIDVIIKRNSFFSKIIISDNGVGIDEKKYRTNSLGLLIVEKLVTDKLGGSFELKSKINEGTTAEIEIKNN